MKVGYARVSMDDQNLDLQHDALKEAGCDKVFEDVMSGAKADRPGLERALEQMRAGDVLIVWKLDRLGRSLKHLIEVVNDLDARGVGFISLTQQLDTTTPSGRLIFHIFGAMAQFEREVIRERTFAGLKAAKARGRVGGRRRVLSNAQIRQMQHMYHQQRMDREEIMEALGLDISKPTFFRYVKE
jgi:DNA invertase Pin-like site-specific DNA recombinase